MSRFAEAHHCRPDPVSDVMDMSRFYVLDGGFGSTATALLTSAASSALWSSSALITAPEVVQEVHKRFVEAGANIITTNSYQCHMDLLKAHHVLDDEEARLVLKKSVDLALNAIEQVHLSKMCLIAGSIGPYGSFLADGSEYTGNYCKSMKIEELECFHFDKIRLLHEYGADFIALETVPAVKEALAMLNVIDQIPGCRCTITFQCRDEAHLADGTDFVQAVEALVRHKAFKRKVLALGVNCVSPSFVAPLLRQANRVNNLSFFRRNNFEPDLKKKPYIVYPNSGETWDAENKIFKGDSLTGEIVLSMEEWLVLGANVVGGCCRVEPEEIAAIRNKMDECIFDVLQRRRALEQRLSQVQWAEIDKCLRQVLRARQRRKRKVDTESSDNALKPSNNGMELFSDLPPFVLVPGQTHQKTIDAYLQRLLRHLEFELIDDQENNDNSKKCLPNYGFWKNDESLVDAAAEMDFVENNIDNHEEDEEAASISLETLNAFLSKLMNLGEKEDWSEMRRLLDQLNSTDGANGHADKEQEMAT